MVMLYLHVVKGDYILVEYSVWNMLCFGIDVVKYFCACNASSICGDI